MFEPGRFCAKPGTKLFDIRKLLAIQKLKYLETIQFESQNLNSIQGENSLFAHLYFKAVLLALLH